MIQLSIISATFNRGPLLERALYWWARQTLPRQYFEYLLVDDGSADDTRAVCERYRREGLPIRVLDAAADLDLPKTPGAWRDGCKLRNAASTHARGANVLLTHPEIVPPPDAAECMLDALAARPGAWVTAVPYWLPPGDYDAIDWRRDPAEFRKLSGFYAESGWPGPPDAPDGKYPFVDYANRYQEHRPHWNSEVFFAMTAEHWRRIGGFREFDVWGPVDVDFFNRRNAMRTPTVLARSPRSPAPSGALMVYHQHHDSPRDMSKVDAALAKIPPYRSPEEARQAGGLSGLYHSGPRERQSAGRAPMADHVARYRWAASLVRPRDLPPHPAGNALGAFVALDAPCGTGYGAASLAGGQGVRVVGIDADAESVLWARRNHAYPGCEFYQGDLANLPLPTASVDLACCFEGLEHVEGQAMALQEFARVLKPGGTLLLSTPQKGVAKGTPWDRHMLERGGLERLLGQECWGIVPWASVEWFHQMRYGSGPDGNPVLPGEPPADAEVMLVRATRGA